MKVDAAICKHCGTEFSEDDVAAAVESSKKSRKYVGLGCLGILLAVGSCAALIGGEDGKNSLEKPSVEIKGAASDKGGVTKPLSSEQKDVVAFMRQMIIQTVSCKGDVDFAQSKIDKAGQDGVPVIDTYQSIKSAEKACGQSKREIQSLRDGSLVPAKQRGLAMQALGECEAAATKRFEAMGVVREFLNAGGDLEMASRFKDLKTAAVGDEAMCRLTLVGLAEKYGIGGDEIDFARP